MSLLIAITGGSGSGKSTLAQALAHALGPDQAVVVLEDWYYVDAAALPDFDPAAFDFDHVAARDHHLLAEHLSELKAGRAVQAPIYSMIHHGREPGGIPVPAVPVVIVEGIHLLATSALAHLFDLKVFVDTPADIRFIRRLLRDQAERGRTARSVIDQYLKTVRPGHERFTEPGRALADFVVADQTAAVVLEDVQAVDRLAAPVLAHPILKAFRGT
ncbi:uridine kinase [Brevundimonas sp.]|uniref:uridine kinase n=1 Tax=Brevundimonas sp. TaxID=1871086 RepID=UPI001DCC9227|nr:uridine kinase [Brevundimonas sp.]MBA4000888.1 uridine kinase [Brevundimonas sp.]